jgi:endoglucanase
MMAYNIKPDIAIVTDVCHDTTTPMIDQKKEGLSKCGDGPVMSRAPSVHNKLFDMITDVADKKKIPYQRRASSRWTGTDTDMFAYVGGGRPSALISLPLRYMHTTVEMVHRDDVENTIKLMYEVLLTIKE